MFVISGISTNDDNKEVYIATEKSYGNLYWTSSLDDAKKFDSAEEALKITRRSTFTAMSVTADRTVRLPIMLQNVKIRSIKIERIILEGSCGVDFSEVIEKFNAKRKAEINKLVEELECAVKELL